MIKVKIKGLEAAIKSVKGIEKKVEKSLQAELNAFGSQAVRDAKQLAPANEGYLRNSISHRMDGPLKVLVVVNADYAAYVEFGTRKFAEQYVASLPPTWQEFARQHKGAGGGSFEELVARITEWVRKKGIAGTYSVKTKRRTGSKAVRAAQDKQAAYAIALKIVREGIKPHPFLVPAVNENVVKLTQNLKNLFK